MTNTSAIPTIRTVATNSLKTYAQKLSTEDRETLKEKVSQVVGQVFYGTMLREFRSTMDETDPLNGGAAGATYRNQLDMEVLQRITASKRFALGREVAERWLGEKGSPSVLAENAMKASGREMGASGNE